MEVKKILFIVLFIILLVIVYKYIMKDTSTLSSLSSAKTLQTITPSSLSSSSGSSSNFSYSIWVYVDDWNYRYGEPKIIFGRMTSVDGTLNKEPCPSVTLGPLQNNLTVSLTVFPTDTTTNTDETIKSYQVHNCIIPNIPIQRWVNILMSVYNRTLDLYLDGKLVKTCILPGVCKIDTNSSIFITPNGGFSGWTSKFQYWTSSTDPQSAWNIYKKGYGGSSLSSMFGQYSVKISLMDGDTEEKSVTVL